MKTNALRVLAFGLLAFAAAAPLLAEPWHRCNGGVKQELIIQPDGVGVWQNMSAGYIGAGTDGKGNVRCTSDELRAHPNGQVFFRVASAPANPGPGAAVRSNQPGGGRQTQAPNAPAFSNGPAPAAARQLLRAPEGLPVLQVAPMPSAALKGGGPVLCYCSDTQVCASCPDARNCSECCQRASGGATQFRQRSAQ